MKERGEEAKTLYNVNIIRSDGNHISAIESDNYDECFELWQALTKAWTEASNENKPFEMITPIVTSFNPVLILEIALVPVMEQKANKHNNPYQQQMVDKGLSSVLSRTGSDLLDGGYS